MSFPFQQNQGQSKAWIGGSDTSGTRYRTMGSSLWICGAATLQRAKHSLRGDVWSWKRIEVGSVWEAFLDVISTAAYTYDFQHCISRKIVFRCLYNFATIPYVYILYICMILYKFVSVYACDEFSVFVSHNLERLILQNCCLLRCKVLQVQKQVVLQHWNRLPG